MIVVTCTVFYQIQPESFHVNPVINWRTMFAYCLGHCTHDLSVFVVYA
jgi:hypothetical protein